MSKKRPKQKPDSWMPLYFGDFNADTSHLSLELRMAYLNLLWWMWRNGAKAPNDDKQLASISGLGMRKWRAAKVTLTTFFSVSDNWLFQKRLTEEYEHAWAVYQKRVNSSKQGVEAQYGESLNLFQEGTERSTKRKTKRSTESHTQQQPHQQQQSSTINQASVETPEEAISSRALGSLRKVCKYLGSIGVDCSTHDEHLQAAIAEGFTADQIIGLAKTRKGAGKPPAYLLTTLRGQRQDAAAHAGPPPPEIDHEKAQLDAEIERLEGEIYNARHDHDTLKSITTERRDQRIQEARERINALIAASRSE